MARSSTTTANPCPYLCPIPSPSIVTPAAERPRNIVADSIAVVPSWSLSSTPKYSVQTRRSTPTKSTFNWIDNHCYPFPIADDSNETIDVIEYKSTRILMASFLIADAKSRTVNWIKALVRTSPDFIEENFHWSFAVVVTFTSKQNLSAQFECL